MKPYLLVAGLLMLSGCDATTPQETMRSTNREFIVEKLGRVDGCTVYRFRDWMDYHYFVKCDDPPQSMMIDPPKKRDD